MVIFAGTRGYLDGVDVADVRRFEAELLEWFRTRHSDLLDSIRDDRQDRRRRRLRGRRQGVRRAVRGAVADGCRRRRIEAQADAELASSRPRPSTCPRKRPTATRPEARPVGPSGRPGDPMPGAQERVLRRRIAQRPEHEEDHPRHGAHRRDPRGQGPAACQRGAPVQRAHHRRSSSDLAAGGAEVDHPLLRQVDEVRQGRRRRARGRPRPGRCVQHRRSSGPPSARSRPPGPRARSSRSSPSAARPRRTSASATTTIDASYEGFTRQAHLRGRPSRSPREVTDLFINGGVRPDRPGVHPVHLDRHPGGRRAPVPAPRDRGRRSPRAATPVPTGRVRVRAVAERGARVAAAPLRRVPPVRGAARLRRLRARRRASGP